ncbi:MAG: LL-diaminopimelate aminotransferase [Defluviitaleaceae bacterium]|nr:LL-diaminopimelate aminotransferase [Defluviitaleaceae bacterium]MCL2274054.1 LL-diaminopimelate aminotransferase [Defluviitaleaceae bacterium]
MKMNANYENLQDSYLFARIGQKVREYKAKNPNADVISLGIGDVTLPLAPAVIEAMQRAVAEMAHEKTFRGYGDYQGEIFLREAVQNYYAGKNVQLELDEIFISDGAKSDCGNLLDIFECPCTALIPAPVYPVYVDTNIMAGNRIVYANGSEENHFLPMPDYAVDTNLIYLCSPNNPTGAVYSHAQLEAWVNYALEKDAVILFDGAYEIFVQDELPTSIFQIPRARECAIEICSFSKTAGFTGTRCGYTVIPSALQRGGVSLNKMWLRRQTTKFNGVSYITQRGAEAALSPTGLTQIKENIRYYQQNARLILDAMRARNIPCIGGQNAPYVWLKCPQVASSAETRHTSWAFFDHLLESANIVGTPGEGFGLDGYFRLSAFAKRENVLRAMERFPTA